MNVPVNIISDLSKKDIHIKIRIIIRSKSNSVDSPTTYSPNDIFYSKKDNVLPTWVEIRNVVNGYKAVSYTHLTLQTTPYV